MWSLDDSGRALCPTTEDYADTYPIGMAVELTSQQPIPLGNVTE